jgi:hypothetical protein
MAVQGSASNGIVPVAARLPMKPRPASGGPEDDFEKPQAGHRRVFVRRHRRILPCVVWLSLTGMGPMPFAAKRERSIIPSRTVGESRLKSIVFKGTCTRSVAVSGGHTARGTCNEWSDKADWLFRVRIEEAEILTRN